MSHLPRRLWRDYTLASSEAYRTSHSPSPTASSSALRIEVGDAEGSQSELFVIASPPTVSDGSRRGTPYTRTDDRLLTLTGFGRTKKTSPPVLYTKTPKALREFIPADADKTLERQRGRDSLTFPSFRFISSFAGNQRCSRSDTARHEKPSAIDAALSANHRERPNGDSARTSPRKVRPTFQPVTRGTSSHVMTSPMPSTRSEEQRAPEGLRLRRRCPRSQIVRSFAKEIESCRSHLFQSLQPGK